MALIRPAVIKLPPYTLPLALKILALMTLAPDKLPPVPVPIIKLPPVTLPVALTAPPVNILPPVMLPLKLMVLA